MPWRYVFTFVFARLLLKSRFQISRSPTSYLSLKTFNLGPKFKYTSIWDPLGQLSLKLLNGSYSPHAPKRVVQAVDFSSIGLNSLGNIRITDFGQSFFAKKPPRGLGTPPQFLAPEMSFGFHPSEKSDIWALACVTFEIQTSMMLFPIFFDTVYVTLGTILNVLGPFPKEWDHLCIYRDQTDFVTVSWWYRGTFELTSPASKVRVFSDSFRHHKAKVSHFT
jgi:hypothetical protein